MTYTNSSRSIKRNHPRVTTTEHLLLLTGSHHGSSRRKSGRLYTLRSQEFELRDDAKGLDKELRSELPDLGTSVVVGKWYVPFIFVKERDAKDQIKRSVYYSMTLEEMGRGFLS